MAPVTVGETLPLVSIVTPCFNRTAFLEQAILSVRSQDHPRIEHIVMDGGSTDGTLDVLRRYEDRLRWVSEPDRGQADALNKAHALARGEMIGWLNSDDIYLPGAISRAVQIFAAQPDLDMFYGTCSLIDERGNTIGMHATKSFDVRRLVWYDSGFFTIQSMFFRRRVFERVGPIDTTLHYAFDYDWMIRVGKQCSVRYVPECLGAFRRHEDAKQGRGHRTAYRREEIMVSRRHGGRWFTPIKSNIYALLERVPGSEMLMRWLTSVKRTLARLGLVPAWL